MLSLRCWDQRAGFPTSTPSYLPPAEFLKLSQEVCLVWSTVVMGGIEPANLFRMIVKPFLWFPLFFLVGVVSNLLYRPRLSQILLDPYYRTIKGLLVLIEKDWLGFGHKFASRIQIISKMDSNEKSPIFMQFLDCLFQVVYQFPTRFEYNQILLVDLWNHSQSGLFGTFLLNSDKQRRSLRARKRTFSLWSFILANVSEYTNSRYAEENIPLEPLEPEIHHLKLWSTCYPPIIPLTDEPSTVS